MILTDGVLYSAAWFCTRRMKEPQRSVTFLLIVCNAGLLIVDHIHFQYNGMLLGTPIASSTAISRLLTSW